MTLDNIRTRMTYGAATMTLVEIGARMAEDANTVSHSEMANIASHFKDGSHCLPFRNC
jgi:hypothetical protein